MEKTAKKIIKWLLMIGLAVCICIAAGAIYLFNEIFPKAGPINLPQMEQVESVSLGDHISDEVRSLGSEDFEHLLAYISEAKPTRRDARSDTPTQRFYYRIALQTSEREYRYFIYKAGGRIYVEVPYEGVYEAETALFDLVEAYAKGS